nr:MAG TPA: hypothetical protein [Caudoviricetes sp.]
MNTEQMFGIIKVFPEHKYGGLQNGLQKMYH